MITRAGCSASQYAAPGVARNNALSVRRGCLREVSIAQSRSSPVYGTTEEATGNPRESDDTEEQATGLRGIPMEVWSGSGATDRLREVVELYSRQSAEQTERIATLTSWLVVLTVVLVVGLVVQIALALFA